jgi:hypothetical protein
MKYWGRGRAPPRPTPWRRFRLGARSIVDRRVAAIVLRPVRSVSAPAARADGGVGGGKGRVSAIPPRAHTRLRCLRMFMGIHHGGAFPRGARARATQSAAHSTARWVRATPMRVEAGCASRATIDGTHLAREPDGDRPRGGHRRPRFRHLRIPRRHRSGSGPVFGARRACDREDGGREVAEPPTPGKRASRRSRECEPDRERVDCVGKRPAQTRTRLRGIGIGGRRSRFIKQGVTNLNLNYEPSDGQKTTIDE